MYWKYNSGDFILHKGITRVTKDLLVLEARRIESIRSK